MTYPQAVLTLVLCLALGQAPKVVVVQTSNLGVPAKRTVELTQLLLDLMKAEKLDAVESKTACNGGACVIATAKRAETAGAISVNFASVGKDAVMDLESLSASDGKAIAQTTFTVKSTDSKLPFEALAFLADTRRALLLLAAADEKVAQVGASKETTVTPANPPPVNEQPAVTAETSSSSMLGLRVGLVATAVLAGAAALVMWWSGQEPKRNAQAREPNDPLRSPYTEREAQQMADIANFRFTVAGGLGIAAGALAGVMLLTFAF